MDFQTNIGERGLFFLYYVFINPSKFCFTNVKGLKSDKNKMYATKDFKLIGKQHFLENKSPILKRKVYSSIKFFTQIFDFFLIGFRTRTYKVKFIIQICSGFFNSAISRSHRYARLGNSALIMDTLKVPPADF